MVVLVPFDGSVLSRSALLHAERASKLYEDTVLAVTAIPRKNASYARENGWLSVGEGFDIDTIVSRLTDQVNDTAPEASFEHVLVDRYASSGTISSRLRRVAREHDTDAIFIGSTNAGHSIIGTASVGGRVAYEDDYDLAIIRNPVPEAESAVSH